MNHDKIRPVRFLFSVKVTLSRGERVSAILPSFLPPQMYVQLSGTQNGTNGLITAVLLQYQDPTFSSLVTTAPSKRYQYEVSRTLFPPVLALAVTVQDGQIVYKKIEAFLKRENDGLALFGFPRLPTDSPTLSINLEKYADVNQRIWKIAHETGFPEQILCHALDGTEITVAWRKVEESIMTTAAAYVGALSITVALQTSLLLAETLGYEPPFFSSMQNENPPGCGDDSDQMAWVFIPFPRPPSLIAWLEYLQNREDSCAWHKVSPLNEGFYLASVESVGLISQGHEAAVIRFVEEKPENSVVQKGKRTPLGTPFIWSFVGRAKLNANVQLAISPPDEGTSGSIAWGCHTDNRLLHVLPYESDFDIRCYGPVRTSYSLKMKSSLPGMKSANSRKLMKSILLDAKKEKPLLPSFSFHDRGS